MSDGKEYIEREALIDRFDYYRDCFVTEHDYDLAVTTVQGAVIENDVVEVVRCRDCKERHSSEYCECRPDDFFCADGERRDGAE